MSVRSATNETLKQKLLKEKCQEMLAELLKDDDNKYCADCEAKGPRWASWNIGVFLCIRCAGIHRQLGVHISRVKSINLDTWQPEQVISMQKMGNLRSRQFYEAKLPKGFKRPVDAGTGLETFIRGKYELRRYIMNDWSPSKHMQEVAETPIDWDKEVSTKSEKRILPKLAIVQPTVLVPDLLNGSLPPTRPCSASGSSANNTPSPDTKFASDDLFADFDIKSCNYSKTMQIKPLNEKNTTLKDDELDFFNQPIQTGQEFSQSQKMTKDSILALYKKQEKQKQQQQQQQQQQPSQPPLQSQQPDRRLYKQETLPPANLQTSMATRKSANAATFKAAMTKNINCDTYLAEVRQKLYENRLFADKNTVVDSKAINDFANFGQFESIKKPNKTADPKTNKFDDDDDDDEFGQFVAFQRNR